MTQPLLQVSLIRFLSTLPFWVDPGYRHLPGNPTRRFKVQIPTAKGSGWGGGISRWVPLDSVPQGAADFQTFRFRKLGWGLLLSLVVFFLAEMPRYEFYFLCLANQNFGQRASGIIFLLLSIVPYCFSKGRSMGVSVGPGKMGEYWTPLCVLCFAPSWTSCGTPGRATARICGYVSRRKLCSCCSASLQLRRGSGFPIVQAIHFMFKWQWVKSNGTILR